jgi:hypothetical protein
MRSVALLRRKPSIAPHFAVRKLLVLCREVKAACGECLIPGELNGRRNLADCLFL